MHSNHKSHKNPTARHYSSLDVFVDMKMPLRMICPCELIKYNEISLVRCCLRQQETSEYGGRVVVTAVSLPSCTHLYRASLVQNVNFI